MTDWITDRQPTEADTDHNGEVILKCFADGRMDSVTGAIDALVDWRHVGAGVPWRHTARWQPLTGALLVPKSQPISLATAQNAKSVLTDRIRAALDNFTDTTGLSVAGVDVTKLYPGYGEAPCYLVDVEVKL